MIIRLGNVWQLNTIQGGDEPQPVVGRLGRGANSETDPKVGFCVVEEVVSIDNLSIPQLVVASNITWFS